MPYAAEISCQCYWSTPFVRRQGSLRDLRSIKLAAYVSRRQLQRIEIGPDLFGLVVLDSGAACSGSVPQTTPP